MGKTDVDPTTERQFKSILLCHVQLVKISLVLLKFEAKQMFWRRVTYQYTIFCLD